LPEIPGGGKLKDDSNRTVGSVFRDFYLGFLPQRTPSHTKETVTNKALRDASRPLRLMIFFAVVDLTHYLQSLKSTQESYS